MEDKIQHDGDGALSLRPEDVSIGYECSCGKVSDLTVLYFCTDCQLLACPSAHCTFEEIEAYYCPHCLENLPSTEAMAFTNRCSSFSNFKYNLRICRCQKCAVCPCCSSSLSLSSKTVRGKGASSSSSRSYFFSCDYCHWDSLGLGLQALSPEALRGIGCSFRCPRAEAHAVPVSPFQMLSFNGRSGRRAT